MVMSKRRLIAGGHAGSAAALAADIGGAATGASVFGAGGVTPAAYRLERLGAGLAAGCVAVSGHVIGEAR